MASYTRLLEVLLREPEMVAGGERLLNSDAFFGVGFSHYPPRFEATRGGISYSLRADNTPRQVRVYWHAEDQAARAADPRRVRTDCFTCRDLTVAETRSLAARLGLEVEGWLSEALAAIGRDVTPTSILNRNVIDPAAFHAGRAGDDTP